MTRPVTSPALDVDSVLLDPGVSVIVCCGSGGVGKTTTAAALALRAAEHGRRVAVLTIDPARRLADSLGLRELDNSPERVEGIDDAAGGSLDALMLDMKRTFDDVVLAHTTAAKADQIFANPFYVALSSSFAGTQEYMAMEKLGQLAACRKWDLIVVDTPPSRSALDFLDAPQRLGRFLDGRMIRLLTVPGRAGGRIGARVVGAGLGLFSRILTKIIGAQVLADISSFVAAMETMFGGFRERAQATYELLRKPDTAFVVVATPEPDALREASYFVDRLRADRMPLAGLVLNRVHRSGSGLSAARASGAAETLAAQGARTAAAVLRVHAERSLVVEGETRLAQRFHAAHPTMPIAVVPALPSDVHDLDGLRSVGTALAGD
ncbi:MAG: ArsA family ATPase [Mycobacteriales bacterium]|nr:MAG: ATPase [Pseudonocardiales bacterium]